METKNGTNSKEKPGHYTWYIMLHQSKLYNIPPEERQISIKTNNYYIYKALSKHHEPFSPWKQDITITQWPSKASLFSYFFINMHVWSNLQPSTTIDQSSSSPTQDRAMETIHLPVFADSFRNLFLITIISTFILAGN